MTTSAGLLDKLLVAGSVLLIVANVIIFSVILTTKSDQLAYAAQQIVAGKRHLNKACTILNYTNLFFYSATGTIA
jgi:hypothetical protein